MLTFCYWLYYFAKKMFCGESMTKVEECTKEETGVGAAIAAGSLMIFILIWKIFCEGIPKTAVTLNNVLGPVR